MSDSEALNLAIGCIIASDLTMNTKNEVIRCLLSIEEQNSDLSGMIAILEDELNMSKSPMESISTTFIPMKGE